MPSKENTKSRSGCLRVLRWMVLLFLISVGSLAALLSSGIPQRIVFRDVLANFLQADVHVESVSLRNPLTIQSLALTQSASQVYAPFFRVDDLAIDYRWDPNAQRHLESVTLIRPQFSFHRDKTSNNFQFMQDFLFAPTESTFDPAPWIPEQLTLTELWAEARFPGYYLRIDNLMASAQLYGLDAGALAVDTQNLGIAWKSAFMPGGPQAHPGSLDLALNWQGTDVSAKAHVDFGRLAQLDGSIDVVTREDGAQLNISIPQASLDDPLWSAMLVEHLPTPIRFDTMRLSNVQLGLRIPETGLQVEAAELDGDVTRISIGPEEAPYYEGPLQVSLHGSYGATTAVEGKIALGEGIALTGQLAQDDDGITGTFELPPWPRGVIGALLPPSYQSVLETFPTLNTLGGTGTVRQSPTGWEVNTSLLTRFGDRDLTPIPLELTYSPGDAGDTINATTEVSLSNGTVQSTIGGLLGFTFNVANVLRDVTVKEWTETLLGAALLPDLHGVFSGDADLTIPADGAPLVVKLNLTSQGLGYGSLNLSESAPLTINGHLQYDLPTGGIHGKSLHLAQEGAVDLTAKNWHVATKSTLVKGAVESSLSLDALATLFQFTELYGNAQLAGVLRIDDQGVQFTDFNATSTDLMYGDDYGVPYGSTLQLLGSLEYGYAANRLSFSPMQAQLDEGTRIEMGEWVLQFPGENTEFSMTAAPFALETDMTVLKVLGYIAEVIGGKASIKSDSLAFVAGGFSGHTAWDIVAEKLVLTEDMAEFENLATTGTYNPGNAEDGAGVVVADKVSVYGMPFGAVNTNVKVDDTRVAVEGLETTFLSGSMHLNAALNYRDPTWHTVGDLRFENIDLAEFTKVFEPPDVILTGRVTGTADVALSTEGLTALDVDLVATESLSMNRSMVRQILMSQYVNDAVGSKSVQKIIEKVIGNDEQRPFDKAILDLGLEDGHIVGVARLESKSLDVTVDIRAEPEALLQAIRSSTGADE